MSKKFRMFALLKINSMTLKQYQEDAKRTCADLGSLQLNLSHMVLGVISENEEFLKAMVDNDMVNAKEEQADQMWYVANYCTYRGFDLEELVGNPHDMNFELDEFESSVSVWDVFTSKLADYVKKFIAYGKPLDEELERKALKVIVWSLTLEGTEFDFSIDLQKNIDKLRARFPEKFTTDKALNRDLDVERKILEG